MINGTNIIDKITKPVPEPITIYEMGFKVVIEYLSNLQELAIQVLLAYWQTEGLFEGEPEVTYLPLPDENSELALITKFVLDQYPEWDKIQFIMEY